MPGVVVTDSTFPTLDVETSVLEPVGLTLQGFQCRTSKEVRRAVRDADYVLTQFAPVDADAVEAMERVRVIVRYGIGVDNVDLAAAREKAIPVCNVPDYCIDEVADHTLALILSGVRHVVANADHVRRGNWGLAVPLSSMRAMRSMAVGVVGFGRIGRAVAARLQPFGCEVLVADPAVGPDEVAATGCRMASTDELWAASDVVTLHCPANAKTHHLVNTNSIAQMRQGVVLVNASRGAVVCTASLVDGLRSGRVGFAALDVLETEPMSADHPLRTLDNVIVHSHIASASEAAVTKLRHDAASIVVRAARGERLLNVVNGVEAWSAQAQSAAGATCG